jgi:tetratricopeptide (TPR) repeat protein
MLLAHPEAEDLGRFVEGTLDDAERTAIVDHIADCDDCRMQVVDAAESVEPAKTESHSWWIGIAASLILMAAIGGWTFNHFRDRLTPVKEAYARVPNRPSEARLSGFPFVPHVTLRGSEEEKDLNLEIMQGEAAELTTLPGDDAKSLHTRGIALLLSDDSNAMKSVPVLQAAADRDPNNAKYQSDLAGALIAAARGNPAMLEKAVAVCDRALRIDPRSPDALFNRAVALQTLHRPDAAAAFERYLAVDSTSPWADEARRDLENLRSLP